jgi:hypothetical protein
MEHGNRRHVPISAQKRYSITANNRQLRAQRDVMWSSHGQTYSQNFPKKKSGLLKYLRCSDELHVTRHTSHVTRHTSHVTRHTSHVTRHTSHVTRHTSHVTHCTSHVTRHTSHVTRHTSHVTRHTSHVTHHTSHVTRHTSHVTRQMLDFIPVDSSHDISVVLLQPQKHYGLSAYFKGAQG